MHRKVRHLALYLQHVWPKSTDLKEKLKHVGLLLIIAFANGCILFVFAVEASSNKSLCLTLCNFYVIYHFFYTLHLQVALEKTSAKCPKSKCK